MARIEIETFIAAPVERVFDLSLSMDLHMDSTASTGEKAIAGRTSGLISLGEEVTWRARHFGVVWEMTMRIEKFERARHFTDAMVRGPFRSMVHQHHFEPAAEGTRMTDQFTFASPLGPLGKLADLLFVRRHLAALLRGRNRVIKEAAEGVGWRKYLGG